MNADDKKKLHDLLREARPLGATNAGEAAIMKSLIGAYALGRASMREEAAKACEASASRYEGAATIRAIKE